MSQKLVLHTKKCFILQGSPEVCGGEFSIQIPVVFFCARNQQKLWMLKDKVPGTPNVHLKNVVPESCTWKKQVIESG